MRVRRSRKKRPIGVGVSCVGQLLEMWRATASAGVAGTGQPRAVIGGRLWSAQPAQDAWRNRGRHGTPALIPSPPMAPSSSSSSLAPTRPSSSSSHRPSLPTTAYLNALTLTSGPPEESLDGFAADISARYARQATALISQQPLGVGAQVAHIASSPAQNDLVSTGTSCATPRRCVRRGAEGTDGRLPEAGTGE